MGLVFRASGLGQAHELKLETWNTNHQNCEAETLPGDSKTYNTVLRALPLGLGFRGLRFRVQGLGLHTLNPKP